MIVFATVLDCEAWCAENHADHRGFWLKIGKVGMAQSVSYAEALVRIGAILREQTGAVRPTLAGLLSLGRYPQLFAPQLLVVNALLHGDYAAMAIGTQVQIEMYPDRLVVKSPGGLYGSVTPGQPGAEAVASTRNTYLAKLLAEIADVDGFPVSENRGSGLPRVMTRLRGAGMSPPDSASARATSTSRCRSTPCSTPRRCSGSEGSARSRCRTRSHKAHALQRADAPAVLSVPTRPRGRGLVASPPSRWSMVVLERT